MKVIVQVLLVSALVVCAGHCFGADWKFYGETTTAQAGDLCMFYDHERVVDSNNSIKLQVKSVSSDDIEKGVMSSVIRSKAAERIARGYVAPLTRLFPKMGDAVYVEEAANDPGIMSRSEITYQLVCTDHKYRRITGRTYSRNGAPEMLLGISPWEQITPDSIADNLARIVCPAT